MIIDRFISSVQYIQTANVPFVSFGTWNEEANRLTNLNKTIQKQGDKFPLVFLVLPIRENYRMSENENTADIKIFIINKTDKNITPQDRHTDELPTLRAYESDLLKALNKNGITFQDYTREELFYPENRLNIPINCIELNINARYCAD